MRIESEITECVAVLSMNEKTGWQKELNYVSWGGDPPKLDIRDWAPDHEKAGRGARLTKAEAKRLREALEEMDLED
ncbi:PC4/YdbC family ssDNA-binding protein [Anaerovorax odorimutans]|uniref:PC4/YdbC family ssDNA-binding protein n=1 Tax=Anaerovorax odorimutans TaxID=109327 RepID=A0ABT1RR72_9FIRM|nr:PC4/YdbC family ssDNA-binding protein [Anaerovorax odorimutans]MCQ4637685.1 PC4/YdbC family ssDNA-binding protein [Anaerovorax odorimutans]